MTIINMCIFQSVRFGRQLEHKWQGNLEEPLHEELVAATARPGGGAHAEYVGLHGDGGVVGEEVVADDVAEVPTPQVVDLQAPFANLVLGI